MFKNNRKHQMAVHKTLLENLHVRLVEIKHLAESRNQLSKPIVTFIKNELIRCRSDVHAVKIANKEVPLFNLQNEIDSLINDIEHGMDEQALSVATMLSTFYPELQKCIEDSTKIEIFAGFEKMVPGDEAEIPGVSYGVKLLLETGEERIHILKSSGDGCLMSDSSNERRRRTLNVVIAVVSDILHAIDPHGKNFSSLDISIRTDIEIFGFTVPSGWKVQQPPATLPEVHHGDFKIIPPSYFEYIVDKKLRFNIFNDQMIVIFSIEKNLPYQYREFGVKFIQGEEIKTKIVLFETVANDISFIVSRMNYTILFVEQFIFNHIIQKDFRDFSDLKVMIETDFDSEDLFNPHQFEIIKQ